MSEEAPDKAAKESEVLPRCEEAEKLINTNEKIEAEKQNLNEVVDELKCIKKEIEDLQKEVPSTSQKSDKEKKLIGNNNNVHKEEADNENATCNAFEREDLIAVLTGDEIQHADLKPNPKSKIELGTVTSSTKTIPSDDTPEDVEIEGEGSYQIMEVVDDEEFAAEPEETLPKTLTPEEERAIAMQQMADLNSKPRGGRAKAETNNKNLTLVQSIRTDWTDDEKTYANDKPQKEVNYLVVKNSNDTIKKVEKPKSPLITSVVVVPAAAKPKKTTENVAKPKEVKEAPKPATNAPPPEVAGFKRSRIIKRKIIWDPDAPETAISYAQLARSKVNSQTNSIAASPKPVAAVAAARKEPVQKKLNVTITKEKPVTKVQAVSVTRPSVAVIGSSTPTGPPANIRVASSTAVTLTTMSLPKKRPQTPLSNGAVGNKKKKIMSEIEKLMGDEGAANMLNDVKRNESSESVNESSPKATGRGARANEKIVKQATVVPRKESPTVAKPKRTPKPKASAQWDYVYNRKASDDNMIIRRRSNSSYSSNASVHRSSIESTAGTPKPATATATATATSSATATKSIQPKITKASANSTNTAGVVTVTTVKQNQQLSSSSSPMPSTSLANQPSTSRRAKAVSGKLAKAQEQISSTSQNLNDSDSDGDTSRTEQNIIADKSGSIAQIEINIKCDKVNFDFTVQTLKTLTRNINSFAKDEDINSLIISFNYGSFWKYFELSNILNEEDNKSKRKSITLEWVAAVKNYLIALAIFPKPLIAAIHGNIFGIGVLQLALFDTIISDETTSFETHYIDLNMIPMGFSFWQSASNINNVLFKKLFWYGERITSTEAHSLGLIYKIVPKDHLTYEAHVHAEYMTDMHSLMKRKLIKERTDIANTGLLTELKAIIEKYNI